MPIYKRKGERQESREGGEKEGQSEENAPVLGITSCREVKEK